MAPIEKSEAQVGRTWDRCITNGLIKTGAGVLVGGLFSMLFFKRKAWPVALGGGIGFGMAVGNCNQNFRRQWNGPPWANHGPWPGKEEWDKFKQQRTAMWEEMKNEGLTWEEMSKLRAEVWEEVIKKYKENKADAAKTQEAQTEQKSD